MTKKCTQVCFLLDETQSMLARKQETIQGFNGYLKELKKDKGDKVLFTFTTFNKSGIKTPYKAENIKNVKDLTEQTYNPQNWTPLYDAIGATVCAIKDQIEKNDLVIFVILTDGEENSSSEYSLLDIKNLIQKHEKDGWKFLFLGVGVDAFKGGSAMGLSASSTFDVGISKAATQTMYRSMATGINTLRETYSSQGIGATMDMCVISDKDRDSLKDKK